MWRVTSTYLQSFFPLTALVVVLAVFCGERHGKSSERSSFYDFEPALNDFTGDARNRGLDAMSDREIHSDEYWDYRREAELERQEKLKVDEHWQADHIDRTRDVQQTANAMRNRL